LIHYPRLKMHHGSHFAGMHRFYHDVQTGNLPSYAFIEPRILFNHNDMHPPVHVPFLTRHSSVLAGEHLIHQVYDAIRRSASRWGSHCQNTLLVITFDEHGGCYDHVAPPVAVPPDAAAPPGQLDFRFDRLGVRVPTVLVSAFIEPGTVVHTPLQHTSLIKTLSEKWHLGSLTARDRSVNDIRAAFNRLIPRSQHAWPVTTPRPLHDEQAINLAHPLHPMQHAFLQLVDGVSDKPELDQHEINTVQDAMRFLHRKKSGHQHGS
jgi:phospholipase C